MQTRSTKHGIIVTRKPSYALPSTMLLNDHTEVKRARTPSTRQKTFSLHDKENIQAFSPNVENSEAYQNEAPHKVHFTDEPIILSKNSNKGTISSESRKSILKRRSLFSSPVEEKKKVQFTEIDRREENEEKRRAEDLAKQLEMNKIKL